MLLLTKLTDKFMDDEIEGWLRQAIRLAIRLVVSQFGLFLCSRRFCQSTNTESTANAKSGNRTSPARISSMSGHKTTDPIMANIIHPPLAGFYRLPPSQSAQPIPHRSTGDHQRRHVRKGLRNLNSSSHLLLIRIKVPDTFPFSGQRPMARDFPSY
jgi:hypothetical protein